MNATDKILLFFDPCHLQHNVVNARCWQPRGKKGTILIKSNSGRQRINILGAYDFQNKETVSLLTKESCNKEKVLEFFEKIVLKYKGGKVYVVLDNASYNHAKIVKEYAKNNNIVLLFLPAYCPNLNLIERLWKFLKKKVVHNEFYEKFPDFVLAAENFFKNLENYESELNSLLSKKFEIIKLE